MWVIGGFENVQLSLAGWIACMLGVVVTSVPGVVLMALVFHSDRSSQDGRRGAAARGGPAGVAGPSSAGFTGRGLADLVGMRVASVAAGVLLAHVGDGGLGIRRLDLERGDEGVLQLDHHLVRLVHDPDPDRVLHGHGRGLPRPLTSRW